MYEIDLSYISRAEILPPFFTFYMELPPGTRLYTWDVDHLSIGLDFDLESAPERLSKLHSAVYGGTKTESEIPNVYNNGIKLRQRQTLADLATSSMPC
ncbi:hypothetical protein E4T42_01560 [Aureobasidium subglaciale]|nr:hypothetical protein E4T42_01560 [Aureobasidium subglaciale]